ncbi:MAG: hypothetical protein RLZZ319_81 [Actinomycetota bacterium]
MPNRIGRASALLASGTIVSRILGFVSAVVLARTVGVIGSGADAFALANQLPNNVYVIIAGGVLSAVLVPQIVKAGLHADGGAAYVNRLLTLGITLVLVVTVVATGLAPLLVSLYAQRGFATDTLGLATAFAWWCMPQILFYAVYSLVGEVLNAKGVFGPFTWAPALNNVVAIAGMVWFGAVFTGDVAIAGSWSVESIAILAGTATLGVAIQALALFAFLGRAGIRFRPDFRFRGVGLGATTKLAAWTFGMILVTQLAGILQSNVASIATEFTEPGLAVLRFGWLVFMLPHSVITVSLGTAYFTRMATDVRDKRWDRLGTDIRESLARVTLFMVVSSAVLAVSSPFVSTVFADRDQSGMAAVISLYALGLVPFGAAFILQRLFYALEDTRTPFFVQLAQTGVFCAGLLIVSAGPVADIATGIALWMSLSTFLQAGLLAALLRRRLGSLGTRQLALSFARFTIGVVPALLLGILVRDALPLADSIVGAVLGASAVGAVMGVAYLATLILVRDSTTRDLLAPLRGSRNNRP